MFLMIDNYDSFVYNLKAYFEELGREIMVRRSDQINIEEIEKMQPEGIILSPGPKRPWDAVRCVETVKCCCREREPSNAWKGDRDPK